MSEKIIISCDSTIDLGTELLKKYQISVLPLSITIASQTYRDGIDITATEIYAYYDHTGELPKTSAVNSADCKSFFTQLTKDGHTVIHFTISSKLSATYQNCASAASAFDNVYVIDTQNLSSGGGLLTLAAAEMAAQGYSAEQIVETCHTLKKQVDASFIISNLEFPYRGGYCSTPIYRSSTILRIKPCIKLKDGKMTVTKKYRGNFKQVVKKYIDDCIDDSSTIIPNHVFITHSGCDSALCQQCVQQLQKLLPDAHIHITEVGAAVASHCGRNTLIFRI